MNNFTKTFYHTLCKTAIKNFYHPLFVRVKKINILYKVWEIIGKIMFLVFLYTIEKIKDAKKAKITCIIPAYKWASENKTATRKIESKSTMFFSKILFCHKNLSVMNEKTLFREKYKYIRYKTSS